MSKYLLWYRKPTDTKYKFFFIYLDFKGPSFIISRTTYLSEFELGLTRDLESILKKSISLIHKFDFSSLRTKFILIHQYFLFLFYSIPYLSLGEKYSENK